MFSFNQVPIDQGLPLMIAKQLSCRGNRLTCYCFYFRIEQSVPDVMQLVKGLQYFLLCVQNLAYKVVTDIKSLTGNNFVLVDIAATVLNCILYFGFFDNLRTSVGNLFPIGLKLCDKTQKLSLVATMLPDPLCLSNSFEISRTLAGFSFLKGRFGLFDISK